jgi:hypothetical protein
MWGVLLDGWGFFCIFAARFGSEGVRMLRSLRIGGGNPENTAMKRVVFGKHVPLLK